MLLLTRCYSSHTPLDKQSWGIQVKEKLYYICTWTNTEDGLGKDNQCLSQQVSVLIHPRSSNFKDSTCGKPYNRVFLMGGGGTNTFSKETSDVCRKVKSLKELTSTLHWSTEISERIRLKSRRNSLSCWSPLQQSKWNSNWNQLRMW